MLPLISIDKQTPRNDKGNTNECNISPNNHEGGLNDEIDSDIGGKFDSKAGATEGFSDRVKHINGKRDYGSMDKGGSRMYDGINGGVGVGEDRVEEAATKNVVVKHVFRVTLEKFAKDVEDVIFKVMIMIFTV